MWEGGRSVPAAPTGNTKSLPSCPPALPAKGKGRGRSIDRVNPGWPESLRKRPDWHYPVQGYRLVPTEASPPGHTHLWILGCR